MISFPNILTPSARSSTDSGSAVQCRSVQPSNRAVAKALLATEAMADDGDCRIG